MNRQDKIDYELNILKRSIGSFPTILILGSPRTILKRYISCFTEFYQLESKDTKWLEDDCHPDFLWMKGQDTKPDEVRMIREKLSPNPVRLPKRIFALSNVDSLHNNAAQALLKLIEEPPRHLITLLTTSHLDFVPITIRSRSFPLEIEPPNNTELEEELRLDGVDEPQWRSFACSSFYDLASDLDIAITKEWHKLWSTVIMGAQIPSDFTAVWPNILQESNKATQIACWCILINLTIRKIKQPLWRDIALWASQERERAFKGRSDKIFISTTLVHIYAYAKTAIKKPS